MRLSSPDAKASITCLYRLTEKIKVTFTLIPFAINSVIAGNPSTVAGTLISKFFRSIISHSCFPCLTVAKVSRANRGSTSIETRPSTPLLVSKAV